MSKKICVFLLLFAVITGIAIAGGLSTTLVEVKLKDLEPGKTYSLQKETGRSLIVKNTTQDLTVELCIDAEKPVDYNLVKGYEPIPDLSWVTIERRHFRKIKPGKTAKTDILIKIPAGKKFAGKKYQVYIYSHTAGKETFRMGLMSRILIETKPATVAEQKKLPLQR